MLVEGGNVPRSISIVLLESLWPAELRVRGKEFLAFQRSQAREAAPLLVRESYLLQGCPERPLPCVWHEVGQCRSFFSNGSYIKNHLLKPTTLQIRRPSQFACKRPLQPGKPCSLKCPMLQQAIGIPCTYPLPIREVLAGEEGVCSPFQPNF